MTDERNAGSGLDRRTLLGLAAGAGAALAAGAVVSETREAAAQTMGPSTQPSLTLTLAGAHQMLMAAEAKAREIGVAMTIVVADEAGNLKAAARMDGNRFSSVEIVMRKAYTAAAFGQPTGAFSQAIYSGDPGRAHSFTQLPNVWLGGGGVPVRVNNMIVGAIGAGGGTPDQDTEVAMAGAAALTADMK